MTAVAEWQRALRSTTFPASLPYATPTKLVNVRGGSVKNVLLYLSLWADYGDGGRAHPGVARLAEAAGISEEIVSRALHLGRELGWIERTEEGARGTRRADVYRLTLPGAPSTSGHPASSGEPSSSEHSAGSGESATTDTGQSQEVPHVRRLSDATRVGPPSRTPSLQEGVTSSTANRDDVPLYDVTTQPSPIEGEVRGRYSARHERRLAAKKSTASTSARWGPADD